MENLKRSKITVTQLPGAVKWRKSKNPVKREDRQPDPKETDKKSLLENSRGQKEGTYTGLHVSNKRPQVQDRTEPILRPPGGVNNNNMCPLRLEEGAESSEGTATELNEATERKKSKNRSISKVRKKKTKKAGNIHPEGNSEDQEEEEEDEKEKENFRQASTEQAEAQDPVRTVLRFHESMEDQQRLGRKVTKASITKERKKSKSSSRSRKPKRTDGRHQQKNAEDLEEKQKEEEEEEEEEGDCSGLQASINKALKTVVRDVFEKLYLKRFNMIHSGKTPFEVLRTIPRAYQECIRNKTLMEILKKNAMEEFDITALFLILRYACGFASEDAQWSDTSIIEGNIKMLKDLRNEDSHWTRRKRKVRDLWLLLYRHVVLLVHLGGLSDQFPAIEQDLDRIKSEMEYKGISPLRRSVQEGILSELKDAFGRTNTTSLKPLVWAGGSFDYQFQVVDTYTKTQLEIHHYSDGLLYADAHSLFDKVNFCKRILLEGESGTGKTSLLQYYASQWASSSSVVPFLKNYKYLLLLDCKAFTNKTASLSDVISGILPKACCKWRQKNIIKEISLAGNQVLILIDALDERTDAFRVAFETIQNRCPEAFFVVTMRPHCTKTIQNLCSEPHTVVTSKGFTFASSLEYTEKIFHTLKRKEDPREFLKEISEFEELVKIPQLLVWTAWFYLEGETNFSSRGEIFDKLTSFMLRKMCFIHGKRIMAKEVPQKGKEWLGIVAETALKMCKEDRVSIDHSSPEVKKLEKTALKLGFRPYEALSTLMQCNSMMTSEGEQISFQFLHESHADFLVAHHVASTGEFKQLQDFSNDRVKNIVQCVTWLIFKNGKSPKTRNLQELISLCAKHISFFDLRLYQSLIIESNYNQLFVKLLCSYPPDNPLIAQQDFSVSITKRPGYRPVVPPCKNIDKNLRLWITGKELKHKKSLEYLIRELKPSKIWLRLCEGIRETEEDPSQNFTELEASYALEMLKNVYGKTPLAELRVSDTTLEGKLQLPECLWWLKLERCTIKENTLFPGSLLKLSFLECSSTGEIRIPKALQSLRMESCTGYKRVGNSNDTLRTIELEDCDLEMLNPLGPSLTRLRISSCRKMKPLDLPRNLKHLHIEGMSPKILYIPTNLRTLEITLITTDELQLGLENLIKVQWDYIEELESLLLNSPSIEAFTLSEIIQSPENLCHLAFDIREILPNASVLLQSCCSVTKNPLCDYLYEVISAAPLPKLCIEFVDKVFSNTAIE